MFIADIDQTYLYVLGFHRWVSYEFESKVGKSTDFESLYVYNTNQSNVQDRRL